LNIAIISDIHANKYALEAVLEHIEKDSFDQVIVNGDLVNRGPNSIEVMEMIWDKGYEIILGNHDDLMCKWIDRSEDLPKEWFDDPFWASVDWVAKSLDESNWLEPLRNLKFKTRIKLDGLPQVLVTHGSPRHYREGYGQRLSDDVLTEIVRDYPSDIYIGSHTHKPMDKSFGDYKFLNTGAVGVPFNKDTRAQYLELRQNGRVWEYEFKKLKYDHAAALKAFESSGYLEAGGLSARIFYEELETASPHLIRFERWAIRNSLPRSFDTWEIYKKEHIDFF